MKKLISILTILTLSTTSFSSMIACSSSKTESKEDLKKDKNGNSIWVKIPAIGDKQITSDDLWKEIKLPDPDGWNGKTRMKMMLDIMKIFNVSVLSNASKIDDKKVETFADWGDLKTLLTQGWNELTTSVTDEIKRQKDAFKNEKQKKWESEWKEFIKKNYDGSEDNLFAEKLINSGEKNATSVLTSILLSNQRAIETIEVKDIASWIQLLIDASDKNEWKTKNTKQVENINKALDQSKTLKNVDEIITHLKTNTNVSKVGSLMSTGVLKINSIALLDKNNKEKFLSSSIDGLSSHFQTFIMQKWFNVKKPLAVSQINFAFKSDSDKLANGITTTDFDEATTKKIDAFLSTAAGTTWEDLMQTYNGTYASDLITLDNTSFTPIFKLAAYGLATGKILDSTTTLASKDLAGLLPLINRDTATANGLYKKVTIQGIDFATFIDDTGLHFLKIEGDNFLKDTTTNLATGNYNKTAQINTINKWNNEFLVKNSVEKTKEINDSTATPYNNWLGNNYLKWLQNQSYINSKVETSKLKFKIEDAFKKFAELSTSTSSDSNEWWFWIFDFFKEYIDKCNGSQDAKWYEKYIKFSGNNHEWFNNILNTLRSSINTNSLNEFINSLNKENKTIKDYGKSYPKLDLSMIKFEESIEEIRSNSKIWNITK